MWLLYTGGCSIQVSGELLAGFYSGFVSYLCDAEDNQCSGVMLQDHASCITPIWRRVGGVKPHPSDV